MPGAKMVDCCTGKPAAAEPPKARAWKWPIASKPLAPNWAAVLSRRSSRLLTCRPRFRSRSSPPPLSFLLLPVPLTSSLL
jgi:hypothetical protein